MRDIREPVSGTWGGAGDPLGAQTPAVQDNLLGNLARISAGSIDDWEALIDPTVSYGANKQILKKHGADDFETEKIEDRRDAKQDIPEKQKKHARQAIAEHFEEIQAAEGDHPVVLDIADQYGEQFAAAQLEREAIDRAEPEPEEPIVTEATAGTPTPAKRTNTATATSATATAEATETNYPGAVGMARLFSAYGAAKARARTKHALATVLPILLLWTRIMAARAASVGSEWGATVRVYLAYWARRLVQEPPSSDFVEATDQQTA